MRKLFCDIAMPASKIVTAIIFITTLSLFLTVCIFYNSTFYSLQEKSSAKQQDLRVLNLLSSQNVKTKKLPQAIIIGVRKCGTRALLDMLYLHPKVKQAIREMHFFDNEETYKNGLEWYKMKMPKSGPDEVTIEKTPSYFVTPQVPKRIKAMNATIKLILTVREPVTRAISDYTQLQTNKHSLESHTPFEQLALFPNNTIDADYPPIAFSIYNNYIDLWLQEFPRKQILLIDGDQLIENPFEQIKLVEKFLGIKPRIEQNNFYFNETKGFYCFKDETSDWCLGDAKGRKHAEVDPSVVSQLRIFFAPHNQKFYKAIGKNLNWPET